MVRETQSASMTRRARFSSMSATLLSSSCRVSARPRLFARGLRTTFGAAAGSPLVQPSSFPISRVASAVDLVAVSSVCVDDDAAGIRTADVSVNARALRTSPPVPSAAPIASFSVAAA